MAQVMLSQFSAEGEFWSIGHQRQPITAGFQREQGFCCSGDQFGGERCSVFVFHFAAFIDERIAAVEQDGKDFGLHQLFLLEQ
jgi:hypothetical protein